MPFDDVGEVPAGPAADDPAGLGEADVACSPGVDGFAGDAEVGGDLWYADGLALHASTIAKVAIDGYNGYMTTTFHKCGDQLACDLCFCLVDPSERGRAEHDRLVHGTIDLTDTAVEVHVA